MAQLLNDDGSRFSSPIPSRTRQASTPTAPATLSLGCARVLQGFDDDLGLALAGPADLLLEPRTQLLRGVEADEPMPVGPATFRGNRAWHGETLARNGGQ